MHLDKFLRSAFAAGVIAISSAVSTVGAFALDITGAGATFPYPIYAKWADAYKKETGNGLNYQSIGSGAGIKQIQAKTVVFGATSSGAGSSPVGAAGFGSCSGQPVRARPGPGAPALGPAGAEGGENAPA